MSDKPKNAPRATLTRADHTILQCIVSDAGSTAGPVASIPNFSYIRNSRSRYDAIRRRLVWLEQNGFAETISRGPRHWRITDAGRAAIKGIRP